MSVVEKVARAIETAQCPHREGPFGGYDYGHNEEFYGPAPDAGRYVVRDFRNAASPDYGKWLHNTNDKDEHEAVFAQMTREHIAHAAIAAVLDDMAEPSEAMIEAGFRARANGMTMAESAAATWQAMIAQYREDAKL